MAYDDGLPRPRVVSYNLASQTYEYMMRMISLGLVEGHIGDQRMPEELRKVIEAMHQVLAGGEVKIEVVHRGNPDIYNDLNRRFEQSMEEANQINKDVGFYFTAS